MKEDPKLPTEDQLSQLIENLEEPYATMVYLFAVSSIRPEELVFKWLDLNPETKNLKVVRAMNKGKLHTPKYHRGTRPIRLTETDVERLLSLKRRVNARDEDWMFPNRIKTGTKMKPGPMRYEEILARKVQPVADRLGLPHITWRLIRHWGSTQMIGNKVDPKVMQQRLGHSRPDIVMRHYALDENADRAADLISGNLGYVIPAEFATNPVEG